MEQRKSSINYKEHSHHESFLRSEILCLVKDLKDVKKAKYNYWEEVVGEKIAKVAAPVKNKKGVLFVKVQDAVWRFELTRSKEELLEKINLHLNKNTIKDIVFI